MALTSCKPAKKGGAKQPRTTSEQKKAAEHAAKDADKGK